MSSQSPSTRKQCDFTKLMMAGYDLELNNGSTQDFYVIFHGPKDTIYEGGVWKVHVTLPDDYPFASPSIGFVNKVLHPNVDEASGSVCLDVINQTWTPLYSLVNVFEVFLPQLLTYPNPSDPLNSDAASLLIRDKQQYEDRVKEYVNLYASKESFERSQRAKNKNVNKNTKKSKNKSILSSSSSTPPSNNNSNINNVNNNITRRIIGENEDINNNNNVHNYANNNIANNNNVYNDSNINENKRLDEEEEEEDDDEFDYDDDMENDKSDFDEIDIDDL